jgi:diguanylate cyclase (GGDEF)-like protein
VASVLRVINVNKLLKFFAIPRNEPDLLQAQLRAFTQQIPMLYAVLIINLWLVAATHLTVAPYWLTIPLPLLFSVVAARRIGTWIKLRYISISNEAAYSRLKSTTWLAVTFPVILVGWSLSLLNYGDLLHQAHVAFFMAVTMFACALCLTQVRPAAFALIGLTSAPFVIWFFSFGAWIFIAIAATLATASVALMVVLSNLHDDFADMVRQHAETDRLNTENDQLANHDSLTGLPNRRNFMSVIARKLAQSRSTGEPFSVGIIDLDGFKPVNDIYGHAVGDLLLMEVAERLRMLVGPHLQFARLGGDEFGLVAWANSDVKASVQLVCEALGQVYNIEGVNPEIAASCGLAEFPNAGDTVEMLLDRADYALYQAKRLDRGNVIVFSDEHKLELEASQKVEHALRHADLEKELRLAYQPVFNQVTGDIECLEGLVRWNDSFLTGLAPSQLIATAERTNVINKVTLVLLKRLLADIKLWPTNIKVSFNLSARSLSSSETMLRVLALIQKSGLDPKRLEVEVTETAVIADLEGSIRALGLLRNLGVSISLDDFGTGYSSLNYVHQLPLDKVKIDRSFIWSISDNEKARSIIKTIITMSRDLSIDCVAEGVETAEQAAFLAESGCQLVQGYLFSRPLEIETATALLMSHQKRRAAITDMRRVNTA